ncbi:hypothetical protein FS837_011463 [Tulasnella sp. UAMH 9824]|nr:hypothetical protein FS837_011463 [Tulasnella sp. UAMH 9824]
MSREVVPPGLTFMRAYISGTDDPQTQTGSPGNQPLLNTSTNEGTEDHGLLPSETSSTWRLPATNTPPLIGGLAEVGPYEGPTRYTPLTPATAWSPNIPTQYPIPNAYNTHQAPPHSHGSVLTAPSPASANAPYLPQSPPGAPFGSSNHLTSFTIPSYPTGHSQGGPPLSDYEFNTFLETGLVPMRPNIPQERDGFTLSNAIETFTNGSVAVARIPWSPQTTLHDGSPVSTSSMNPPRTGHTDSATYDYRTPTLARGATHIATLALGHTSEPGMHRLPLIGFNVLSPPLAYPTPFSPSHAYAEVQNPIADSGAVSSPEYRRLAWRPVATKSGETQGPESTLGPPPATRELPEGRGTSSSTGLPPASHASDRDEEIRQAWIDLDRYCRCKDRTKKPLRHWEDQCPYNLNKRPLLYCKLPGCQNKVGFRTLHNLRRHQENASYHRPRNESEDRLR